MDNKAGKDLDLAHYIGNLLLEGTGCILCLSRAHMGSDDEFFFRHKGYSIGLAHYGVPAHGYLEPPIKDFSIKGLQRILQISDYF